MSPVKDNKQIEDQEGNDEAGPMPRRVRKPPSRFNDYVMYQYVILPILDGRR